MNTLDYLVDMPVAAEVLDEKEPDAIILGGYGFGENNRQMMIVKELTKRKSKYKFHLCLMESNRGYREEDELRAHLRERLRMIIDADETKNAAKSLIASWGESQSTNSDIPLVNWMSSNQVLNDSELLKYVETYGVHATVE